MGVISEILFGRWPEFALRFPSALAASACLFLVAGFARQIAGVPVALLSAFILSTTYGFAHLAADGRVDMVFCLCVTAALLVWLRNPPRAPHFIGIAIGLAVLAKGPLGAALVLATISAMAMVDVLLFRRCARETFWRLVRPGLCWAIVLPLPWFCLASQSGGTAFL